MNKRLCTWIALFLAVPSLAFAQAGVPNTPAAALSSVERDRAEGLIKLDVVVTNAAGKLVAGLEPADFTLLEDGHPENSLVRLLWWSRSRV